MMRSISPHSLAVRTSPFQGGGHGFESRWGCQCKKLSWIRTREGEAVANVPVARLQAVNQASSASADTQSLAAKQRRDCRIPLGMPITTLTASGRFFRMEAMRKAGSFSEFFLALFFNLLLNYPLGLITLLLWVLHLLLGIPGFIPLIGLAVWFFVAFFITLFLSLFAYLGESPTRKRAKRNPHTSEDTESMAKPYQPSEIINTMDVSDKHSSE